MEIAAIVVSTLALVGAGVAIRRSAGSVGTDRDELRDRVDSLEALQHELVDHAAETRAAAYDASRRQIRAVEFRIGELDADTEAGVRAELHRAERDGARILADLERTAARSDGLRLGDARRAERAVALRAARMAARVALLEAKGTCLAAEDGAGFQVERRLIDASLLVAEARTLLADDPVLRDHPLLEVKRCLEDAVADLRSDDHDRSSSIRAFAAAVDDVTRRLEEVERETRHPPQVGG